MSYSSSSTHGALTFTNSWARAPVPYGVGATGVECMQISASLLRDLSTRLNTTATLELLRQNAAAAASQQPGNPKHATHPGRLWLGLS